MERLCSVSKLEVPVVPKPIYLFAYTEADLIDAFMLQQEDSRIYFEDKLLSYKSHLKRADRKTRVIYMHKGQIHDASNHELLSRSSLNIDT